MFRRPVSSSRMNSVGWADNTMEIEFKNGSVGSALSRLDKIHRYSRV